jgi:hypothetical protein
MQKALEQMNIQLHKTLTDITGVTGIRIIKAILDGERDPIKLAQLRHYNPRSSQETIAKSLECDWREEHLFFLRQEFELYGIFRQKIAEYDQKIEVCLGAFESKVDPGEKPLPKYKNGNKKARGNQPNLDLRNPLYRMIGVDLVAIGGFDVMTIQTIISEVGLDMTPWPTEKHFCSWLGLCPNNKVTGGRVKDTLSKKIVNRAACAFRMAAQAAGKSQSVLGGYYRRMKIRLGPSQAITATAPNWPGSSTAYSNMAWIMWTQDSMTTNKSTDKESSTTSKKRARLHGYELLQSHELRTAVS